MQDKEHDDMKRKYFKIISITILLLFNANIIAQDLEKLIHNAQYKDESCLTVSQVFLNEFNKIFKKQNTTVESGTIIQKSYIILRFIKIDSNLYYTIGLDRLFPSTIIVQDGMIDLDTNCMYYYSINGHDIIISDYSDSDGYGLYVPCEEANKQALFEKKNYNVSYMGDEPLKYFRTYQVFQDSIVIVPLIIPLKYDNEKDAMLNIIEEKPKKRKYEQRLPKKH